ncbi:shikimate kinase [Sulfurospirillum arcachonense]|uniref:shikimate kinase n=1 Tax=Sulfurospirillum arcachonense TaxID=57666 RepID=UPI0004692B85|nr:shikimate kinase [Sulfurospirillum arcachonense]
MSKNLVLIGFMGVGKGTIARALMKETGLVGVDCDDLIESMENRKVKAIFEAEGEEYFRALEKKTAKWLEKSVKNTLISTGGGFYKVKNLHKIGKVIYLKSSFEGILERIKSSANSEKKLAKRPLLSDMNKAKALFDERDPLYKEKADIIINVENKSIDEIIKNILQEIK